MYVINRRKKMKCTYDPFRKLINYDHFDVNSLLGPIYDWLLNGSHGEKSVDVLLINYGMPTSEMEGSITDEGMYKSVYKGLIININNNITTIASRVLNQGPAA